MNLSVILAPVFVHFLVVVTPGPANILIMQRSASIGRPAGLLTAVGVVTGSAMWATLVFSAVTFSYYLSAWATIFLGVFGAGYLAYLGFKIVSNRKDHVAGGMESVEYFVGVKAYLQGFLLHATNPKAFFGWLAIISVGRVDTATDGTLLIILLLCILQAAIVFFSYAMIFSTDSVISLYQKYKEIVDFASGAILIGFAFVTLYQLGVDIIGMRLSG